MVGKDGGMASDRAQRLAANERFIRDANLEIERQSQELRLEPGAPEDYELELFCACGRSDCDERVVISIAEYDRVHSRPHRFVVVPGHANPEVERVVEHARGFDIVEKLPQYQAPDPASGY
jgi:hypothetical protein